MEKITNTPNINKILLIIAVVVTIIIALTIIATMSFSTPHVMAPKAPNAPHTQNNILLTILLNRP